MSIRKCGGEGSWVTRTKRCGGAERRHERLWWPHVGVQSTYWTGSLVVNHPTVRLVFMLIMLPLFNNKECTAGVTPFHLCKASSKQPSCPLTNGSCSPSWSLFSSSFFIGLPYCCLSHLCLCFSLSLFFGFYSSACKVCCIKTCYASTLIAFLPFCWIS